MTVYTGMTYQLTRLKFVTIVREIVDEVNETGHLSLDFTLHQDLKFKNLINTLPEFYKLDFKVERLGLSPEKAQIFNWERTLINLTGQSRLVRLHRPFLSKGYRNKEFSKCRLTCITAARTSIAILRSANKSVKFLEKWWIAAFYAFASAIVIFIDLIHDDPLNPDAIEKRKEIQSALDMLKSARSFSSCADASASLLEGLLAEEIIQKPRLKRKFGHEDNENDDQPKSQELSILVKRLLAEGQSAKVTSPITRSITPDIKNEYKSWNNNNNNNNNKINTANNFMNNSLNNSDLSVSPSQQQILTDDLLQKVFEESNSVDTSNFNFSLSSQDLPIFGLNSFNLNFPTQSNDLYQQQQQQQMFNESNVNNSNNNLNNYNQISDNVNGNSNDIYNSWGVLGGNSLTYL